jgi:hypothetical protein
MRLPFLQFESDFLAHGAAELANLARCTPAQAIGHVALLRAWAVSHASDEAPPDGWVPGDAAGRRIEAAAHWQGERGVLLEALLDAGQVERAEDGFRVCHLEPYIKAWEQNRKAKERMRTVRERSANMVVSVTNGAVAGDARSAKFGGQTQTQTQTQTQEETPSAVAIAPTGGQASLVSIPASTPPEKPKPPRKEPKSEHHALWRALEAEYARVMRHPYASGNGGQDAAAVKWLRESAKATLEEAVRRWGNLLRWSQGGFPSVTGFGSLRQHWNAAEVVKATPATAEPPPKPKMRIL